MDNQKLTKLVRLGLKKSGIINEPAVLKVVEVIELELEIEAEMREDEPFEMARPDPVAHLPSAVEAITEAPSFVQGSSPFEKTAPLSRADVTATQVATVPAPSSILLATELDMEKEISRSGQAQVAVVPKPRIRLQSLSGGTRRMNLDAAQAAVEAATPDFLDVVADGRAHTVRIFRSTSQLPSSGKANDPHDMIKVCYLASGVGKDMETQILVTVAEAQAGIDAEKIIQQVRKNAFAIYRPRPTSLSPRMPPVPRAEINILVDEGTRQHAETVNEINRNLEEQQREIAARAALIAGKR